MSFTSIEDRNLNFAPVGRNYPRTLSSRILLGLGASISVLSLLGIVYLYMFYQSQNKAVLAAFGDALSRYQDTPPAPEEIVSLSHEVCALQTDLGSIGAFFQPITTSINEGGWCGNYVRVFILLAQASGYEVQKLHLKTGNRSHTMAEIYVDGKWRAVDPFFNLVYRLPSGEMATFDDIYRMPELSLAPDQVDTVADPRLDGIYAKYVPIWPALFQDALSMDWRLRESSLYHTGILILNYPQSLFYEGSRRAVIPNWIDRPEFLGMYLLSGVFIVTSGSMAFWLYRADTRRKRTEKVPIIWGFK